MNDESYRLLVFLHAILHEGAFNECPKGCKEAYEKRNGKKAPISG